MSESTTACAAPDPPPIGACAACAAMGFLIADLGVRTLKS